MSKSEKQIADARFITNDKGEKEFAVIPITEYEQIIEMLEDYGLAEAMKVAEGGKLYGKAEAEKLLGDD